MATVAEQAAQSVPTKSVGMPQLDASTFPNQIFWLVVTLLVLYFVLSRVALPRIASVLAERQGTITNDIATAEELKLKATEAEAAYEKALADARIEAQNIVAAAKADIQADLNAAIADADAEIAARSAESEKRIGEIRESALANVEQVAKDTAREIVAVLSPVSADDAAIDAAVTSRIKG